MAYDKRFIFKNGKLVLAGLNEWSIFIECNECRILNTNIAHLQVSTVFLGLNHQFQPGGRPLLFETLVFDCKNLVEAFGRKVRAAVDRYDGLRYSTFAEAEIGHYEIAARVHADHPRNTPVEKRFPLGEFLPGGKEKARLMQAHWEANPLKDL